MKNTRLIMMANQIADFFKAYPEEKAVSGIKTHLTSFWTEDMIIELKSYIENKQGTSNLHPLCIKVFQSI